MAKINVEEVVAKAQGMFDDRRHRRKLLIYLSDKRLKACNDARLYGLKGMALRALSRGRTPGKDRDKSLKAAVTALTKAIELKPGDACLYRERGVVRQWLHDSEGAFQDYDAAIRLGPKDPASYLARASLWRVNRKFARAKADIAKAINLQPKNPAPYYERSRLWARLKNKPNEIKDFTQAVQLDPKARAGVYGHLGDLCYKSRKYDLAFKHYNHALDMDSDIDFWLVDYALVNIFNAIVSVNDGSARRIYEACIPLADLLNRIRELTDNSIVGGYDNLNRPVVHFTKLLVADILVSNDENRFRFYHVSHMNDPEEGKILLQILSDPAIDESFNNGSRNEESNIYLGSFLPDTHADELVMWRTYGKDENDSEAKGCSIVIDRKFFDVEPIAPPPTPADRADMKPETEARKKEPRSRYDTQMHKVIYYDRKTRQILGNNGEEIKRELKRLESMLGRIIARFKKRGEKNSAINRAIDSIVYYVITEIRYYFKSSDYAYENEERVILFALPNSPLVKIEDSKTLPKRLYVEAKNPIRKHIKKIVLGPRVVHPERWSYLKVKMIKDKHELQLIKSGCKFQ